MSLAAHTAAPDVPRPVAEVALRSARAAPEPATSLEEHRSALRRYLARRLRPQDDPDDYVQEVYLRVLASGPERGPIANLKGFLFRAASNLVIDKHRRRETSMETAHIALDEDLRADGTSDPERLAIGRDALGRLGAAVGALPPVARQAFLLVRVDGLSHREAAARLGIETKAVSRHVERSLARLAATMLDAGE